MGKKFGFSFSWKRASGISGVKNRISRKTGIPLTKSGRQRKVGRAAGCFVATVAYGGYDSVNVKFLRAFRDEILSKYRLGRLFIWFYYRIGPNLALLVEKTPTMKNTARRHLDFLIKLIESHTSLRLKNFQKTK